MSKISFEKEILKVIANLDKIPDEFWQPAEDGSMVIWLLDRADGTAGSYETSDERLGITKDGQILYGFSSGCSCWEGWQGGDYEKKITYKEFALKNIGTFPRSEDTTYDSKICEGKEYDLKFSEGWEQECANNLKDVMLLLKRKVEPLEVLAAKNAEVRRYLMKRVGYDKIREHASTKIIHTDGTSELLEINKEKYVKVKDSSTDREYLLYVPDFVQTCKRAIAWTFDLDEIEYNPEIET